MGDSVNPCCDSCSGTCMLWRVYGCVLWICKAIWTHRTNRSFQTVSKVCCCSVGIYPWLLWSDSYGGTSDDCILYIYNRNVCVGISVTSKDVRYGSVHIEWKRVLKGRISRARHVLWKSFIYVNLLIVYLLSPVDDYSIAVICEKIRFNKWSIFERKMNKLWTTGVMTAYLRPFRTFFGKKGELEKVIKWDILLWYLLNEVKG